MKKEGLQRKTGHVWFRFVCSVDSEKGGTLKRGHKPFMQIFDIVNAFSHTTFTSGHIVNQDEDVYNGLMQLEMQNGLGRRYRRGGRRRQPP